MIVTSSETVVEKKIVETLGLVKGNTVRARWVGKDIVAGLRNIVGGEIKEYTELMTNAREQSLQRMIEEAEKLGANAIVSVRFTTSTISHSAAEFLAYGTAVKIK